MQCLLSLNDSLMVGSVEISVLEVRHDSVKLGIIDPNASPTYREEVLFLNSEDEDLDYNDDVEAKSIPFEFEPFHSFAISVL